MFERRPARSRGRAPPARTSRQRRDAEYPSAMAMVGRHEVAIISISDGLVVPLRRPWSRSSLLSSSCYVMYLHSEGSLIEYW